MSGSDYLKELQEIEQQQGVARLRTIAVEFFSTLDRLPKLKQEVDAMQQMQGVNFDDLAASLEQRLDKAAELLSRLDMLPQEISQSNDIKEMWHNLQHTITLRTINTWSSRFDETCSKVKNQIIQERAEERAQQKAEEKRKKNEAEAKKKAEDERKMIEAEAKTKAVHEEEERQKSKIKELSSSIIGKGTLAWLGFLLIVVWRDPRAREGLFLYSAVIQAIIMIFSYGVWRWELSNIKNGYLLNFDMRASVLYWVAGFLVNILLVDDLSVIVRGMFFIGFLSYLIFAIYIHKKEYKEVYAGPNSSM